MNFKALLDVDYSEEIRRFLLDEDFEVYDLPEKELLVEEVAMRHFNIIFPNCSPCNSCSDTTVPTIKKIKELDPRVEIICIGEKRDDAMAVEAVKNGATACFGKSFDPTLLRETINRVKEIANIRSETYEMETALHEKYVVANMVSKNSTMLDIFSLIRRVAPYYRTMLITGETGTGKEVLARAIHHLSPSSKKPFVACNCSGFIETLIESELFGHVKGAFTGAISNKKGFFETAGDGTMLLD